MIHVYIENTYIVLPYIKNIDLTKLGELIIFEPWRENYDFSQPSKIFLIYGNTIYSYSIYLSTSDIHPFEYIIIKKYMKSHNT